MKVTYKIINNQCLNFIAQTESRFIIIRNKDMHEKPGQAAHALCKFLNLGKNKNQINAACMMMRKFTTSTKKSEHPTLDQNSTSRTDKPKEQKESLKITNHSSAKKQEKEQKRKNFTKPKGFS